eukprot:TRINITY_DN20000_c0_g3_i1.p1 TRINITY_DN20000_c0_g3~~TRINITY_DN20000_c0_g3_i1.p1  ORF type:complete len:105 (+),score=0.21 TRINITY_DN20000_c0_g3_i1:272-586(+)
MMTAWSYEYAEVKRNATEETTNISFDNSWISWTLWLQRTGACKLGEVAEDCDFVDVSLSTPGNDSMLLLSSSSDVDWVAKRSPTLPATPSDTILGTGPATGHGI